MHDQSHNKSTVLGIAHYSHFIILFVCLCVSFVVSLRLIHLLETDTNVCCRVVEWLSMSLCIPGFIYLFIFVWIWSYSFFQFSYFDYFIYIVYYIYISFNHNYIVVLNDTRNYYARLPGISGQNIVPNTSKWSYFHFNMIVFHQFKRFCITDSERVNRNCVIIAMYSYSQRKIVQLK